MRGWGWGECQDFPSKIFCFTVSKNFEGKPFRVSLTSGLANFQVQGRYVTNICLKFYESQNSESFRRGTLLCCVSEKFWQRKSFWIRGRGKYQDFPSNVFRLTVPKNAVGESFSLSLISCIEKNCMRGLGGVSRVSVESFLSHSAEIFRRASL